MSNTTCFELKIQCPPSQSCLQTIRLFTSLFTKSCQAIPADFPATNFDWSAQDIVYHVSKSKVKRPDIQNKNGVNCKEKAYTID
ncbi:hypothetical protein DPMN_082056 [Dreissena polymorpha]|uniref:Uncharacterized protein n=1 Tax=Dreissena polymorpha TaxID=45954 RepID=A0A9D3Y9A3_DREPO|nr:hypothetical protein DPMN_082056 [Dreissena polymorpha]